MAKIPYQGTEVVARRIDQRLDKIDDDAAAGGSIAVIVPIMMPRITIGTDKVWIQGKNATNNATISFLVGVHGYIA